MITLKSEDEIIKNWLNIKSPLVSICCSTYNHEDYIEDTIRGFLMQETNFPFEILIHDDASTDRTQEIIRKYEKIYPNIIKPIYQVENQYSKGVKVNFTYNYSRARGKYIALCEGDDYWIDKEKLQKQIDVLENNENVMLCIHSTKIFDMKIGNFSEPNKFRLNTGDKEFNAEEVIVRGGEFGHTSSFVFRKSMIEDPPKWYLEYPTGDTPLRLLSVHKGSIYYIDREMSVYRIGVSGSWTQRVKAKDKFISHWSKAINMLEEFDRYTDFKYTSAVRKRKSSVAYLILMTSINDSAGEIDYSKYFKLLSFEDKLKYLVKTKAPNFARSLRKVKSKFIVRNG